MKDLFVKYKGLFFEFLRYCIVGGVSFVIDFGILTVFYQFVFHQSGQYSLGISTALGFIAGLIVNYLLSIFFVFLSAKNDKKGRDLKSFFAFAIIGIIGLTLTELGMHLGVNMLTWNYMIVKIIVTALILIWNYVMRKIIIFK